MQGTLVLIYDDEAKNVEPMVGGVFKDNKKLLYEVLHLFLDQVVVLPSLEGNRVVRTSESAGKTNPEALGHSQEEPTTT